MITKYIEKMFNDSFKKEYFETYWAIDLHGTVLIPNYRKDKLEADFYPWAKKTLQLMSKRPDIIMIIYSSSYPDELEYYQKIFKENDIEFKYVNENPDIDTVKGNFGYYEKKFYHNVLIDNHAGFDATIEWKPMYDLFIKYNKDGFLPNINWTTKK